MTGYELSKAFDASVHFIWYAQTSQIYLELNKLEQKGFVSSELVVQTDKPNKKLYSITPQGKTEFLHWLCGESKNLTKGMKNEFLMKVFFSGNNTPEKTIAMLKTFLADCRQCLAEISGIPKAVVAQYRERVEPGQSLYWDFSADFMMSYLDMCAGWAQRCIDRLEEKQ